jgi:ferredoxin-NADP reductase
MSHQILGRIVFLLFSLHGLFYLNFFIQSGFLTKRIKDKDVIFGLISFALFSAISTSALGRIRQWNYRAFYRIHILIALVIVVPLNLHVHHIRVYVWQIIAINGINWLLRALSMKAYTGTVKLLPGTDLVQISIPLTSRSPAITWQPGQHIYLGAPSQRFHSSDATQNKIATLYGFFNPFTIASVPVKDKELLLVARTIAGNTKKLAALTQSVAEQENRDVPLLLEGPYGASTHFPDFSLFDKVLLVAGGVGATFVVPVYRSVIDVHDPDRVRFVWAVRTFADTQWAFPESEEQNEENVDDEPHSACPAEIYVTRGTNATTRTNEASEDIELEESNRLLGTGNEASISRKDMVLRAGRPNIPAIVDEVFSKGSRVAVVACGPKRLTRRVSASVEQWVKQGHEVYYHEEAFGW